MKAILIIADGLGGRPSDMGGKTCLEAADTPHLDALVGRGSLGLVDPISPGVRPGSDTAHLSLLGYDPYMVYTGRGVFECLGIGMAVNPGDVGFRANFATVTSTTDDGFIIEDRRAGRISSGQQELAIALSEICLQEELGIEFEFRASTQHRGALLLRGEGLSRYVTENDPHATGTGPLRFLPAIGHDDPSARRTARALNELVERSHTVLRDHPVNRKREQDGEYPANYILARGASDLPHLEQIEAIYGVRGAVIAGGALYRGVGLACGMEAIDAPGDTGGLDTDLVSKVETALKALQRLDYVFIHVKGTDNAGHDQDAAGKTAFIERIDAELIAPLLDGIDWKETHLAVTGDHTTPIDCGDHTAEPLPILFVGPNVLRDSTVAFGEREAGRGGLGRFSGRVLPMLFNYNNWCPKYGS